MATGDFTENPGSRVIWVDAVAAGSVPSSRRADALRSRNALGAIPRVDFRLCDPPGPKEPLAGRERLITADHQLPVNRISEM